MPHAFILPADEAADDEEYPCQAEETVDEEWDEGEAYADAAKLDEDGEDAEDDEHACEEDAEHAETGMHVPQFNNTIYEEDDSCCACNAKDDDLAKDGEGEADKAKLGEEGDASKEEEEESARDAEELPHREALKPHECFKHFGRSVIVGVNREHAG